MKIGSYFTSLLIIISFSIFNLANCISLLAQEDDQIWYNMVSVPPSPNAAALGKYGEIPVDKSTGIPNISIPILDFSQGGINLSISLSYHAGGIRVQDEASWVGLGWSLNAGGVITRTMNGLPDDHNSGFLENADKVPLTQIIDKELEIPGIQNTTYTRINEIAKGYIDYEPDFFYYNLGGISGTFMFGNNKQPIILPISNIKIIPIYNEYRITGFILTTPDGIVYQFGDVNTENYTEKTNVTFEGPDPEDYISSWYLQKIYNPLSQYSILFEYDTYPITSSVNYSETKTYGYNVFGNYDLLSYNQSQCITYVNDAKFLRRILLGDS